MGDFLMAYDFFKVVKNNLNTEAQRHRDKKLARCPVFKKLFFAMRKK